MRYIKKFIEDIPIERRKFVLSKMKKFESELLEVLSFSQMQKGFWVRKIKGTDIYKFRINNGDRILFRYDNDGENKEVVYVAYSKHDDQIRIGKSFNKNIRKIKTYELGLYEIDETVYEEREQESLLDLYITEVYRETYLRIQKENILDDEYIPICVESDLVKDKQFLTQSQFECIYKKRNPILVLGCAGSGKTMIALTKLRAEYENGNQYIYITESNQGKQLARELCLWLKEDEKASIFYTLRELCCKVLQTQDIDIIGFPQFKIWMEKSNWNIMNDLSKSDIWNEIKSIIKGCSLGESSKISKESYLISSDSSLSKAQKKELYVLATAYQNWLTKEGYWDENDLISAAIKASEKPMFDGIIYDEIQELNNLGIHFLSKITANNNNILLLGDRYQRLNMVYENFDILKLNLVKTLSLQVLNKNFRNKSGVIDWNNRLKLLYNNQEFEEAVIQGKYPMYINHSRHGKQLFQRVNKDARSIIIVGNEEEKERLKLKGYVMGRVFTVEQIRGLEYNKVYCYNMLEYTQKRKNYNALYIASSRAKKELFFVEEKDSEFINWFEGCYESLSEEILFKTFQKEDNREIWLEEAKNLEISEKYEQSVYAYEQAGEVERANLCKKANEKQIAAIALEEQGQIVDIYCQKLTEQKIEKVIKILFDRGLKLKLSWIEVTIYSTPDNLPKTRNLYLDSVQNIERIADTLSNCISGSHFSNSHITIKWVQYTKKEDYRIDIVNNQIQIKENYCDIRRKEEKIRKEMRINFIKQQGFPTRTHLKEIENEEKVYKQSTEDILREIFG